MPAGFKTLSVTFSFIKTSIVNTIFILLSVNFNFGPSTCILLISDINISNGNISTNQSSTWNPAKKLTNFSEKEVDTNSQLPCFITSVVTQSQSNNTSTSISHYWKKKLGWSSFDQFSDVSCLENENQPVPGIPDLMLNGTTYSSIDFQNSLDHQSSVAFAIDKFIFQLKQKAIINEQSSILSQNPQRNNGTDEMLEGGSDKNDHDDGEERKKEEKKALLMRYWKLYGAMDIALRVLNNKQSNQILSLLKGPGFVLNFETARLNGNIEDVRFHLGHILKSCFDCTGLESKKLVLLAKASGVKDKALYGAIGYSCQNNTQVQSQNQTSASIHSYSTSQNLLLLHPSQYQIVTLCFTFVFYWWI